MLAAELALTFDSTGIGPGFRSGLANLSFAFELSARQNNQAANSVAFMRPQQRKLNAQELPSP